MTVSQWPFSLTSVAFVGHPIQSVEAGSCLDVPGLYGGVERPRDDAVDVGAQRRDCVGVSTESADALA